MSVGLGPSLGHDSGNEGGLRTTDYSIKASDNHAERRSWTDEEDGG
jgi:hypothetical protein